MSVMGYFERRRGELRMPKKEDEHGIRYEGAVLTGKDPVERAVERDGVLAALRRGLRGEFGRREDYDAVLRAHCRFDKEG
jgi:hypothetical protein